MAKTKKYIIDGDVEQEVIEDEKVETNIISATDQKKILSQINDEVQLCKPYNEGKRAIMLQRLKLYNNQRRDSDKVGDPLMFTVFNTVLANLYDDKLMVAWQGRGGQGDEDVEENLNALSEFDYDIMQKAILDYEWDWDTGFFGRGLMLMMEFDRSPGLMCPAPEVIDAVTFTRDPRATSVNGNLRGHGAMRFGGYEVGATYWELKKLLGYFNLNLLKKDKEINSILDEARNARREAQGLDDLAGKEEALKKYENYEFRLNNWFTSIKGVKHLITTANGGRTLVRLIKLKHNDKWPIADRVLYPMAHDWDGVSIPDLTEDKQRMRAVLLNLGIISAKGDAMASYLFDKDRIKNKNDLNFRSQKFIGVSGRVDNAIMPIQKSQVHQYVNVIMDILDTAAQRATAATEMRQGIQSSEKRTLGEQQIAFATGDVRFSMSAKIFGWSEATFWRFWYLLYKRYFKDKIDEKVIRIQGALAPIWRPLLRDNIIAEVDPDVKIESKTISETKRLRDQQSFAGFAAMVLQDPDNNRRFIQKKLAKLNGMTKEETNMAFPPTVDEIQADDENQLINNNKLPKISVNDDHRVHIDIHAKANQNGYALAHTRAHKKLMLIKRNRIDLFPPVQPPAFQLPGQGQEVKPAPAPVQ